MTMRQAIKAASEYANQQHYNPSQYNIKATKKGNVWEVYFQRKKEYKPPPGDFFTIYIDETSGSVEQIIHGK